MLTALEQRCLDRFSQARHLVGVGRNGHAVDEQRVAVRGVGDGVELREHVLDGHKLAVVHQARVSGL